MPLSGLRVVELGTGSAVAYAGRIFAGLGADVRKVEPDGGDPGRAEPPLVDAGDGRMESAYFAWLNARKHSVVLAEDDPVLHELIGRADVLLDARTPDTVRVGPLAHAALRVAYPRLVITAISWFGESGPYRDFAASDAMCRSLAGLIELIGPKDRPVSIVDHQADVVAGLCAFIGTMAGLMDGGRRYELSIHEALILLSESHTAQGPNGPRGRWGVNRFSTTFPIGVYKCKEGWLGVGLSTPQQWIDFCDLFGIPEVAADPRFRLGTDRAKLADEIEAHFAPKILTRTATEWFGEGLARKLPFAIVPDMKDLLQQRVSRDNGAFPEVAIGEARFEGPLLPLRLTQTPPRQGGRAPLAGEARPLPPYRSPRPDGAGNALPLAGARVVDFTMGWAGPLVARTMADLGAEVIKIESCRHYDWWRGQDHSEHAYATRIYEKRPLFLALNRNKTGITIDLTTPEGIAVAKRLVARADAVVENYSREVMPKLGLDYESLKQVNPELVMVSMAAFPKGPWETGRAYGFTLEQAAGVPSVTGFADGPPMLNHYAYGDPIGGLNGTASLLAGLWHKRLTGKGQHIDLSQVECMLPLVAPWLIEQSVSGEVTPRMGNRHPRFVPHNIYRCAGDDAFIHIAATSDAMWRALAPKIGLPGLSGASAPDRRAREDDIDAAIERWTRARNADVAMSDLQAAGVAAGVVRSPFDLAEDPHLKARGFWRMVDRAFCGPNIQSSLPFREEAVPYPVRHAAPTLGEFNDAVLGGILGLSQAERADLQAREIIGTAGLPPRRRHSR